MSDLVGDPPEDKFSHKGAHLAPVACYNLYLELVYLLVGLNFQKKAWENHLFGKEFT